MGEKNIERGTRKGGKFDKKKEREKIKKSMCLKVHKLRQKECVRSKHLHVMGVGKINIFGGGRGNMFCGPLETRGSTLKATI